MRDRNRATASRRPGIFRHALRGSNGVALITVILAVALITTITAAMIARQHIDIRRTTNIIHANKAYEYARGIEIWATRLLARDMLQEEEKVDHLGEDWASALPLTDVAGGTITGQILDLQGRFNLNNLVQTAVRDATAQDAIAQDAIAQGNDEQTRPSRESARFQRLLERCDLAPGLVAPVIDWLDEDTKRSYPDGAEDYAYLGLDVPYRAANAAMASPSELSLVLGFDYDAYVCLEPFISTLPTHTAINVNTAPADVLMALMNGITATQAEQLASRREVEPYVSVDDFLAQMDIVGIPIPETDADAFGDNTLSVNSNHYLIVADTQIGNVRVRLFSQVERLDNGNVRVLSRGRENL
ncbi:MAG: type II secretion system minor pseudopilin GspK [Gammaproteobacteria bacterium]|nr:type II secretion system minor pseudopilin GspK [Gammaproteobacteria bacterium]